MSWELVLLFTILTLGVFGLIQAFRQVFWLKKLNQLTTALTSLSIAVGSWIAASVLQIIGVINQARATQIALGADIAQAPNQATGYLLVVLAWVLSLIAWIFFIRWSIVFRNSLVSFLQLNSIPLKPRLVFSILFNVFYFQNLMGKIEVRVAAARAAGMSAI